MAKEQWVRSASGSGIYEVYHLIQAFEEMMEVKLEVSLTAELVDGHRELMGKATAFDLKADLPVPPVLASASVKCSATNLVTVEAALIHLLYVLDAKIAREEMQPNTSG